MKNKSSLVLFSLLWLVVLAAYTVLLIQLGDGANIVLRAIPGVICLAAGVTWSDLLKSFRASGDHPARA